MASTANLLEISRHLEIQKFIFMSSGAVYERTNDVKTKLSENEIIALRYILLNGSFLDLDDNYGLDKSFFREIKSLPFL